MLSVNLVPRVPLASLAGRRVALGSPVAHVVLLAQMWLEPRARRHARATSSARPTWPAMLLEADAAVSSATPRCAPLHDAPRHGLRRHDLGQAWRDWTGLPMVFAVWAVRASPSPRPTRAWSRTSTRRSCESRRALPTELDEVAEAAARWEPVGARRWRHYFRTLDFSLGERQVAGSASSPVEPPRGAPSPRCPRPAPSSSSAEAGWATPEAAA